MSKTGRMTVTASRREADLVSHITGISRGSIPGEARKAERPPRLIGAKAKRADARAGD